MCKFITFYKMFGDKVKKKKNGEEKGREGKCVEIEKVPRDEVGRFC